MGLNFKRLIPGLVEYEARVKRYRQLQDVLLLMYALLEYGWCQGEYRRDGKGEYTDFNSKAEAWCLRGAAWAASTELEILQWELFELWRVMETVEDSVSGFFAAEFYNDAIGRTQEDVLRLVELTWNVLEIETNSFAFLRKPPWEA